MSRGEIIDNLLESDEPSIRWKTRVNVLDEDRESGKIKALEKEVKDSPRAKALLQKVDKSGHLKANVYAKWQGAQWVLMTLADIGYPRGDKSLVPTADDMVRTWLGDRFFNEFVAEAKPDAYKKLGAGIPLMQGRHRTCASQQGNALYSVLKLGLGDERMGDRGCVVCAAEIWADKDLETVLVEAFE